MKTYDVLPEKWVDVVYYRYRKLRDETLKKGEKDRDNICIGCPGMRAYMTADYIYEICIMDKCIKQYPHMIDNKEFK